MFHYLQSLNARFEILSRGNWLICMASTSYTTPSYVWTSYTRRNCIECIVGGCENPFFVCISNESVCADLVLRTIKRRFDSVLSTTIHHWWCWWWWWILFYFAEETYTKRERMQLKHYFIIYIYTSIVAGVERTVQVFGCIVYKQSSDSLSYMHWWICKVPIHFR